MLTPWEQVGWGGGNAPSGRTAGLQRACRTWDAGTLLLDPSLCWVVGKDPGGAASDPPPSLTKVRGNSQITRGVWEGAMLPGPADLGG